MPDDMIPPADAPTSWWTIAVDCGGEADVFLSAMEELRDESWLPQSVTPILKSSSWKVGEAEMTADGGVVLVCVFRRMSADERMAIQRQMQGQPMVVDPRRLRGQ
jgi:hypothetical protein